MERNATRMKKLLPALLLPSTLHCLVFVQDAGKSDFFEQFFRNLLVDYLEAERLLAITEPQEGERYAGSSTSLETSSMILAGSPYN